MRNKVMVINSIYEHENNRSLLASLSKFGLFFDVKQKKYVVHHFMMH